MSLKAPAKLCYEMVSNGLHDAELWLFKDSLFLRFLALVEVFDDFSPENRIQHVELL